jgi:hypothetical protein
MKIVKYFIDIGEINQFERQECLEYICNYCFFKYANEMPIQVRDGWILLFENDKEYNYNLDIIPYLAFI